MTAVQSVVLLDSLRDFTVENFAEVARGGAAIEFTTAAVARMDARRAAFLRYIEREPVPWIYNVTGWVKLGQARLMTVEERAAQAARRIAPGAVLSDEDSPDRSLPARIVRGAIFCRLANFIEGHAAVGSELATATAAMLQQTVLPQPRFGHGAAGEMSLLSQLFGALVERSTLGPKEASAMVNGAPYAAALTTDTLLATGPLLHAVIEQGARCIAALGAPLDAYDARLGDLWGDPYAARALQLLAELLPAASVGAGARLPQAPVSYRALPRLLARALRQLAQLSDGAQRALRAVTDNPLVVAEPDGLRTLGNGGFFDAETAPLLDATAGVAADLARLLEKLAVRLAESADSSRASPEAQFALRARVSAMAGYAEDAAAVATRTALPATDGGGAPQNDLISPVLQAWIKCATASGHLASSVCMLSAIVDALRGVETDPAPLRAELCRRMVSVTAPLPVSSIPPVRTTGE